MLSTDDENNPLHLMMLEDKESGYRVKIILLKDGKVHSIANKKDDKNHYDVHIRKWMHRFNDKGIDDIPIQKSTITNNTNFTKNIEKQIVDMASVKSMILWFGIFHMVIMLDQQAFLCVLLKTGR